jgi:hypothetical protein
MPFSLRFHSKLFMQAQKASLTTHAKGETSKRRTVRPGSTTAIGRLGGQSGAGA